jgi:hypothetical protein
MKPLKIVIAVTLSALVVAALVAPIGPMPGFFIGGKQTAPPASWPDTSGVHEIRLKVPGTLPRVVTIWVIDHAGELYVLGHRDSGWVKMIGQGARVEMRLGDRTYSLNATPLTEGWQPVFEAYVAKYKPNYPEIVAGHAASGRGPRPRCLSFEPHLSKVRRWWHRPRVPSLPLEGVEHSSVQELAAVHYPREPAEVCDVGEWVGVDEQERGRRAHRNTTQLGLSGRARRGHRRRGEHLGRGHADLDQALQFEVQHLAVPLQHVGARDDIDARARRLGRNPLHPGIGLSTRRRDLRAGVVDRGLVADECRVEEGSVGLQHTEDLVAQRAVELIRQCREAFARQLQFRLQVLEHRLAVLDRPQTSARRVGPGHDERHVSSHGETDGACFIGNGSESRAVRGPVYLEEVHAARLEIAYGDASLGVSGD